MLKVWFAATILCANLFANHATSADSVHFHGSPEDQSNSPEQRGLWQYQIPNNNPIFPVPNRPNSHYMILGPGDYQTQPHSPDLIIKNPRQNPFYLPNSMSPSEAFGNLPGYLVFVYQPPELYHEVQASSQILKPPPKKQKNKDVVEEDDFDMGDLSQFHIECEKVNPNEMGTIRVEGFDFACKYSKKQFADQKKRLDVAPVKKAIPKAASKIIPKVTPKVTPKPTVKTTPKPTAKPAARTVKKGGVSPPPTKATPKPMPKPKLNPTPKPKPTPTKRTVLKPKRNMQVKPTRKMRRKPPVKQRKPLQKKRNITPRKGQRKPRSLPTDESNKTNKEPIPKHSLKYSYETQENEIIKRPYMEYLVQQFLTKIIYKNPNGTTSVPNHFYLECNKLNSGQYGIYDFDCTQLNIFDGKYILKESTSTTIDYRTISPFSQGASDPPTVPKNKKTYDHWTGNEIEEISGNYRRTDPK